MTVRGYRVCRFERLVEQLVEVVEETRQGHANGPVGRWATPALVVVPSLDMGAYVEHAIARVDGAAVNYEFVTLQKFWGERIEEASGRYAVLDREVMKTLLLELFDDVDDLPAGCREPIEGYLSNRRELTIRRTSDEAERVDAISRQTRKYQLARAVATVFEEYVYSRMELLEAWQEGKEIFDGAADAAASVERWQSEMWRQLVDAESGGGGPRRYDLSSAPESILDRRCSEAVRRSAARRQHPFGVAERKSRNTTHIYLGFSSIGHTRGITSTSTGLQNGPRHY